MGLRRRLVLATFVIVALVVAGAAWLAASGGVRYSEIVFVGMTGRASVVQNDLYAGDLRTGQTRKLREVGNAKMAVAPDGSKAAACHRDNQTSGLQVLDVEGGKATATFELPAQASCLAFAWSPDGRRLAIVDSTVSSASNQSSRLRMFDVASTALTLRWQKDLTQALTFYDLAWSPDARWIAGTGPTLALVDANDGAIGALGSGQWAGWTRDNTGAFWNGGAVSIVDPKVSGPGQTIFTADLTKGDLIEAAAIAPDGRHVAIGTVRLTPLSGGLVVADAPDWHTRLVGSVRFAEVSGQVSWSRDGSRLAYCGTDQANKGTGAIYELASGNTVALELQTRSCHLVGWSPDSAYLAYVVTTPTRSTRLAVAGRTGGNGRLYDETIRLSADEVGWR